MKSHEIGPVRWGVTILGAIVSVVLLISVVFAGLRWSLREFDQFVDSKSIIKPENMKESKE